MGCVYLVTSRIDGKKYIGKTLISMIRRKAAHEAEAARGSQRYFHKALRKYSSDNFVWSVLFESSDEQLLFDTEKHFIALHNTKAPFGYNLTDGGDGVSGYTHNYEDYKKYSKARVGKPGNATGFKHSKETCLKNRRVGLANGMTKLTDEDKREIRWRLELGEAHKSIAKRFGVSKSTIDHLW